MSEQAPPKIEFPCKDYPIKVLGETSDQFLDFVLDITEKFAPGFDRSKVALKDSSKGRFTSVTVLITATGIEQLEQYHQALRENSAVKMVI